MMHSIYLDFLGSNEEPYWQVGHYSVDSSGNEYFSGIAGIPAFKSMEQAAAVASHLNGGKAPTTHSESAVELARAVQALNRAALNVFRDRNHAALDEFEAAERAALVLAKEILNAVSD